MPKTTQKLTSGLKVSTLADVHQVKSASFSEANAGLIELLAHPITSIATYAWHELHARKVVGVPV